MSNLFLTPSSAPADTPSGHRPASSSGLFILSLLTIQLWTNEPICNLWPSEVSHSTLASIQVLRLVLEELMWWRTSCSTMSTRPAATEGLSSLVTEALTADRLQPWVFYFHYKILWSTMVKGCLQKKKMWQMSYRVWPPPNVTKNAMYFLRN